MKRTLAAFILAATLLVGCGGDLPVQFNPGCYETPVGEVCPKTTTTVQ